jgi:hypothetical protein
MVSNPVMRGNKPSGTVKISRRHKSREQQHANAHRRCAVTHPCVQSLHNEDIVHRAAVNDIKKHVAPRVLSAQAEGNAPGQRDLAYSIGAGDHFYSVHTERQRRSGMKLKEWCARCALRNFQLRPKQIFGWNPILTGPLLWRLLCFRQRTLLHSQPSTPAQSINPTPAICRGRGSIVPQPNLPARIFLLRLLTADDRATERVQDERTADCVLRGTGSSQPAATAAAAAAATAERHQPPGRQQPRPTRTPHATSTSHPGRAVDGYQPPAAQQAAARCSVSY